MSTHHGAIRNRPQGRINEEYVSPEWFNVHVTPDLRAVIHSYGCLIRCNVCNWTEALDHAFEYAWRRGGFGFSARHLTDLQDWISRELGLAIGPEY